MNKKKFKQLRKRNGQQNSVVTTVVKLALICKMTKSNIIWLQYSVQDLLLDIHEEKNQSKLAMCT